ncbi:MAG: hypothetical protein AAF352_01530 [Pseudomonadota bacterium]
MFIQSLAFKYANNPETIYIFQEKLDPWGFEVFGVHLFNQTGIFSQYVVGTAELAASVLLLIGLIKKNLTIRFLGALMGLGIISGAIIFHLFTPLGVAVVDADGTSDGGQLFAMACSVWLATAILLFLSKDHILGLLSKR